MRDLRKVDGAEVPVMVWVALGVVAVWSLGPLYLSLEQLPDLLRGDIHGRRIMASDWFGLVPPLMLAAVFWLVAVQLHQRNRKARIALIVGSAIFAAIALIIVLTDFDAEFLITAVVFTVPLLVVPFLPGVAQWCHD